MEGAEMKLPEGYTVWDPANYIEDEEDARLYLEAVAEEDPGDGSLIRSALCDVARARNMSGLARRVGISRAGLYKTLSPDGNPSFATIMRLTRALGVQVVLRPIPPDHPGTEEASDSTEAKSPTPSVG